MAAIRVGFGEEFQPAFSNGLPDVIVSIRAPREGGDVARVLFSPFGSVSIRAPREGGDVGRIVKAWLENGFNPRPPRRGR